VQVGLNCLESGELFGAEQGLNLPVLLVRNVIHPLTRLTPGERKIRQRIPTKAKAPFNAKAQRRGVIDRELRAGKTDALKAIRKQQKPLIGMLCQWPDAAEQSVGFIIRPRRKKQGVGITRTRATTERKGPQPGDLQMAVLAFEQSLKISTEIESHNSAAPEIADKEVAAMFAESVRR
jgi:hypothetical protein